MPSNITSRTFINIGITIATTLAIASNAWAQAWPSRPIKIIVSAPPGGATDLLARAYGEHISQKVGQPVVVENKPGAEGIVGAQALKAAPADGHTLMLTISATMLGNRVLFQDLPYDPDRDFVLTSSMSPGHVPFVVHKSTGATNLKEFVEYAKRNKVTYGSYAPGSYTHIAITEINKHFGLNIEVVHYRGEAPMWQDFNAGVIQAASGSYLAASNILRTGTGRAVAIWPTRSKRLPDVPTFTEQGVNAKIFHLRGFIGLLGPAGMPQNIVEKLSALTVAGGKTERIQTLLDTFGIEAVVGHVASKKLYDEEKPLWIELVRSLRLTPQ